MSQDEPHLS